MTSTDRWPRRALVVGGSMAGLFAALNLLRRGWDVEIFERSEVELTGRGAGIVSHPELVAGLTAVGLCPGHDFGVDIVRRRVFDRSGAVTHEIARSQTTTSWNRLFKMLRDGFPPERFHLGKDLRRVMQRAAGVAAHFADGSRAEGDVLVGADGFRSTVRTHDLPDVQPIYAGYAAWRGLVDETALSPAVHRELFPYFGFSLPDGEQMLGYPVAGPMNDLRPGHRRYNFVWYRPADETAELPRLLTDVSGRTHVLSIPPPLIAPSVIAEMRAAAERLLAPPFAEVVRLTAEPFLQPIYDLASPRMALGRAALIGDAAFVARPHVGAGVTKAAEDAAALAAALDIEPDIEAALRRFETERLPAGARIVAEARRLGARLKRSFATAEERALADAHGAPAAVMADTASLHFLRRRQTVSA